MAGWLAAAAIAEACEIPGDFTPRGRAESSGIVVVFRTLPAMVEVGTPFRLELVLCADSGSPALTRVDATMPEHRHGMNYRPTVSARGGGLYVADGFLFHMPGRWQLVFDVARGERRARLTTDLVVE